MRKRRAAMEAANTPPLEPSPVEREQAGREAAMRAQEQAHLQAAYEQAQKIKAAGMARGLRFRGETKEERQLGPHYATPDGEPYGSSRSWRG